MYDSTMDTNEIRLTRLNQLIAKYGSQAKLCEATGIGASYMSQMVNRIRTMGEKTARNIEAKLELPELWMDSLEEQHTSIDEQILALVEKLPQEDRQKVALKIMQDAMDIK